MTYEAVEEVAEHLTGELGAKRWLTVEVSHLRDLLKWSVEKTSGSGAGWAIEHSLLGDSVVHALLADVENALLTREVLVWPRPSRKEVLGGAVRFYRHGSDFGDLVAVVERAGGAQDDALGYLMDYAADGSWRSMVPGSAMHSDGAVRSDCDGSV